MTDEDIKNEAQPEEAESEVLTKEAELEASEQESEDNDAIEEIDSKTLAAAEKRARALSDEEKQAKLKSLKPILEGALLALGEAMPLKRMQSLFEEHEIPSKGLLLEALNMIQGDCDGRGFALVEVGSGWRFQVREDYAPWVNRLWDEKPQKYSRALLETLALIAYRQPLTRGDIEEVRGVAVSSHIMKTLTEREWVKIVGHRDVPGRPALYATTRQFLDYFGLKSLDELPSLGELKDIDSLNADLELDEKKPDTAISSDDLAPKPIDFSQVEEIEDPQDESEEQNTDSQPSELAGSQEQDGDKEQASTESEAEHSSDDSLEHHLDESLDGGEEQHRDEQNIDAADAEPENINDEQVASGFEKEQSLVDQQNEVDDVSVDELTTELEQENDEALAHVASENEGEPLQKREEPAAENSLFGSVTADLYQEDKDDE
ncbi:SMC-Scp complex subunit ScpB [Agaribacterium sp. ZY112]|uniref:SMC-Scp complex subunit ScpB n=1 Tax=Agaribacterium sp. ZY112 TaxID=3233574 RepID=UPI00352551F5